MNTQFRFFFLFFSFMMLNHTMLLHSGDSSSSDEKIFDSKATNYYNNPDLITKSEENMPQKHGRAQKKNLKAIEEDPSPEESSSVNSQTNHPSIPIDILYKKQKLNNSPNEPDDSPDEGESSPEINLKRSLSTILPISVVRTQRQLCEQRIPLYKLNNLGESESDDSDFASEILKRTNQYFIIPNVLIYSFIDQLSAIINADKTNQKQLYLKLQASFIWKTINKEKSTDIANNKVKYSLEDFVAGSICVDNLYREHKNLFLKNDNPNFFKPFLTGGLSLEIQNELFQEVFNSNSVAYLNRALAHTLIIHGFTLELLEYYHNKEEQRKHLHAQTQIPTVEDILKSNVKHLNEISQKIQVFNQYIRVDYVNQEVQEIVKGKIISAVRYFNINVNTQHRKCLFEKNQIGAKKFLEMALSNLSKQTYQTMTNRTLARYGKSL